MISEKQSLLYALSIKPKYKASTDYTWKPINMYSLSLILSLSSSLSVSVGENSPLQESTARNWGYQQKYCYKNECKDVKKCNNVECNCVKLRYACGCNKEVEYYFKKVGYGGSDGDGIESYKKKVCIDYKLCHYKKGETWRKCDKETNRKKVKVRCCGNYYWNQIQGMYAGCTCWDNLRFDARFVAVLKWNVMMIINSSCGSLTCSECVLWFWSFAVAQRGLFKRSGGFWLYTESISHYFIKMSNAVSSIVKTFHLF